MTFESAFFSVLAFTLIREIWFMRQVHKLVDKIMCKSLHEYKLSQTIGKPRETPKEDDDDELEEDLGTLQGII